MMPHPSTSRRQKLKKENPEKYELLEKNRIRVKSWRDRRKKKLEEGLYTINELEEIKKKTEMEKIRSRERYWNIKAKKKYATGKTKSIPAPSTKRPYDMTRNELLCHKAAMRKRLCDKESWQEKAATFLKRREQNLKKCIEHLSFKPTTSEVVPHEGRISLKNIFNKKSPHSSTIYQRRQEERFDTHQEYLKGQKALTRRRNINTPCQLSDQNESMAQPIKEEENQLKDKRKEEKEKHISCQTITPEAQKPQSQIKKICKISEDDRRTYLPEKKRKECAQQSVQKKITVRLKEKLRKRVKSLNTISETVQMSETLRQTDNSLHSQENISESERLFSEKLISEVKKRECLYNSFLPDYKLRTTVREAWLEISFILDKPVDVVKSKWTSLWNFFFEARQMTGLSSDGKSSSDFNDCLIKELQFLDCYIQHDPKFISSEYSPFGRSCDPPIDDTDISDVKVITDVDEPPTASDIFDSSQYSETLESHQSQKSTSPISQNSRSAEASTSRCTDSEDPDLLYFKSLLPSVKELNEEEREDFFQMINCELFLLLRRKRKNRSNEIFHL